MEIKFSHEKDNIFEAINMDKKEALKLTLGFLTEMVTGEEKIEEVYFSSSGAEIATIETGEFEKPSPDYERFKTNTLVQKAYIATMTCLLKNVESQNSGFDAKLFYYLISSFTNSEKVSEIIEKIYRMSISDSTFYILTMVIIKRNVEAIFESMAMILKNISSEEDEKEKEKLIEATVQETLETLRESGIPITPELENTIRKKAAEKLGIKIENDTNTASSKDITKEDSKIPDNINWDDLLK